MKVLSSTTDVAAFFKVVRKSALSLLMIDYDGTIAPFKVNRDEALPDPELAKLLVEMQASKKCRVAIISGRSLSDLIHKLPPSLLVEVWGSHGLERRLPGGSLWSYPLPENLRAELDKECAYFHPLREMETEKKPFSLALHWRGKNRQEQLELEKLARERWGPLAEEGSFEVHPFNGGIELRLRGEGKGRAVLQILNEVGPEVPCAYIGDDLTDEDAFLALGNRGLKLLLRNHSQKTHADIELVSMRELTEFLNRWIEEIQT